MPLIEVKCKNCGMSIEIDEDGDSAICPYCGSKYIPDFYRNNEKGYDQISMTVLSTKVDETIKTYTSFKYELIYNRIQSETKSRLAFKRPKRFKNQSKILELENEYESIINNIDAIEYSHAEPYFIFFPFLLIGIILMMPGVAIVKDDKQIGMGFIIISAILIFLGVLFLLASIGKKLEAKEFNNKLDAQIKKERERLKEIVEEASKL